MKRSRLIVVLMVVVIFVVNASTVAAAGAIASPVRQAAAGALAALTVAVFLAVVANRLTEALIVPLFDKMAWDKFWLLYISWIIAGVVVAVSGVNLFGDYIPNSPLAGKVLTAIVAGGGGNFIADLFNSQSKKTA
jgi:hypothetical protein